MKTGYCSNCKIDIKLKSKSHWYIFFILWMISPYIILPVIIRSIIFSLIIIPLIFVLLTILLLAYFNKTIWYCSRCKIKGTIIEKGGSKK